MLKGQTLPVHFDGRVRSTQVRCLIKVEAQTCEVTGPHRPRPVCVWKYTLPPAGGAVKPHAKGMDAERVRAGKNKEQPPTSWVGQGQADQTPWSPTSAGIAVGSGPRRAWSEGSATPHLQSTEAPAMADELLGLKID